MGIQLMLSASTEESCLMEKRILTMPALHSFHRTVTNKEFYYIIHTANLAWTSAARKPRILAWPHFVLVPSEQHVCSSRMSRSERVAQAATTENEPRSQWVRGTALSPSEKVPQNPRETHHLLLLLLLVARPLRADKRFVISLNACVILLFQIRFTSLRLTKVTM